MYGLVRDEKGKSHILDMDYVSGTELGARVEIDEFPYGSDPYSAILVDIGTYEAMLEKEKEIECLSNEQLVDTGTKRARRATSVASKFVPPVAPVLKRKPVKKSVDPPVIPSLLSASIPTPTMSEDDDDDEMDEMTTKEMLRTLLQKVSKIEKNMRDRRRWEDEVSDDLTSIKAYCKIAAQTRESDAIDMTTVVKSVETIEESLANVESKVESVSERMPEKLPVEYIYLPEAAVREMDLPTESSTIFAQKLANRVFKAEDLLKAVENRDQRRYDWIVSTVYRRRAYTERNTTLSELKTRIKAHFDQRARRDRDALKMPHPPAPRKQRQMDLAKRKDELVARVAIMEKEAQEKLEGIRKEKVAAAAKFALRQKGVVDEEGEPNVYGIIDRPPALSRALPSGRASSTLSGRQPRVPARLRSQSDPPRGRKTVVKSERMEYEEMDEEGQMEMDRDQREAYDDWMRDN